MSTEQQLFLLRHFIDRSRFQKQPLFAAFVDLKKAYDSVQHDLLWASLRRLGVHGSMLAAVQSLYDGGTMRMKISGRAGASGTARVGVRQGCPVSPTLFGIFFDDLHARLVADCPTAGLDCQGLSVPALFYADDVVLLSDTASGLQQLLDSMQGFCLASGLTISIPKTEVVVFGGGHHPCAWAVAGQQLQRSQSFTYLGMLFHEDRHIKHAIQHRHAKALASLGSIFSRYRDLECANSVQLLIRLQQAILQPCASYACEVWAPAAAVAGPLKELQQLQPGLDRTPSNHEGCPQGCLILVRAKPSPKSDNVRSCEGCPHDQTKNVRAQKFCRPGQNWQGGHSQKTHQMFQTC